MGFKTDNQTNKVSDAPWWTSCRLMLAVVGMFGTICVYMMRANMSVAIVCMTYDPNSTLPEDEDNLTTIATPQVWKYDMSGIPPGPNAGILYEGQSKQGEFDWDRQLRGWVLSSFFFGYLATQLPGGWLANRFGAKVVIAVAVGMLSVFSILTPVAARTSVYLLMAVQAVKGLASGLYFPAFYHAFGRWTTKNDRSVIVALFSSGGSSGAILSSILSGLLCEYGFDGGWPSIFYIFGMAGIAWCVVWYFTGFSSPQEHPRISQAELSYIHDQAPSNPQAKSAQVPWTKLLTCIPLYALCFMQLAQGWSWYVALTTLPQYMKDVLNFDMTQNGLYNALPYIANVIITISGSTVADAIISKRLLSVTQTRKLLQTLAMLPSAGISVGVAFLPGNQTALAIVLITFWVGFMGLRHSGGNANAVEIAPKFAGVVMGIENMFANMSGVITPPVVAALTPSVSKYYQGTTYEDEREHVSPEGRTTGPSRGTDAFMSTLGTRDEWRNVFLLSAVIPVIGMLVYVIFADAEEQKWAKVDDEVLDVPEHGATGSQQSGKDRALDNAAFIGTSDENGIIMISTKF